MKTLLTRNHQLFKYEHVFGNTTQFDENMSVDAGFLDIEPLGSVACTCFTADKVKSGETGFQYDHDWLWSEMVKSGKATQSGASPKDAFAEAVIGQKRLTGEIDSSTAYFQCDIGEYDFFTNVKSAMQIEFNSGFKRPVGVGTAWYVEFNHLTPDAVMPLGKTHVSDHEWVVCGWDAEHPDMFRIDAHLGYYLYMPRDVFNAAVDATYGSVALTLAESSQETIQFLKEQNYSYIQAVIDWVYNQVKILQAKINTIPPVQPLPSKPPISMNEPTNMIVRWANIISREEGANPVLNNPGNFKYSTLLASWGGQKANAGSDGGYFCRFDTYEHGFTALCNFLTLGCEDELKAYHNARTIKEFTLVYTNHPKPEFDYSDTVIKNLGITADTLINSFL